MFSIFNREVELRPELFQCRKKEHSYKSWTVGCVCRIKRDLSGLGLQERRDLPRLFWSESGIRAAHLEKDSS